MIVVDASAVVDVLIGGTRGDRIAAVLADQGDLFAPSHILVEVTSAMWRLERAGVLTAAQSETCIADLARMPITAVDIQLILRASWAFRHFLRVTDAFYVACAQSLALPLLTSDQRLVEAVATRVDVRLVG